MQQIKAFILLVLTAAMVAAAPQSRNTLKSYLQTGDVPTEAQFAELIDSFSNTLATGFTLSNPTSAGATSVSVDRTAVFMPINTMIAIDPYTINCEVRKVTGISTAILSVNTPLWYAHSAEAQVVLLSGSDVPLKFYGAWGNQSNDDTNAIQAALDDQARALELLWVTGQGQSYVVSTPITGPPSVRLKNASFYAKNSGGNWAPIDANNAMFMTQQDVIVNFTVSDSTNVITAVTTTGVPTAHGISTVLTEPTYTFANNHKVMFKRVTGAGGITPGRIYYTVNRTTNTFQLAETVLGPAVEITSDGTGILYTGVGGIGRLYLQDITFQGQHLAGLNGMYVQTQQPSDVWKLRVENMGGSGIILGGQDGAFNNVLTNECEVGLDMQSASMMKFISYNSEQCNTGIKLTLSNSNIFSGLHFELLSGAGSSTTTTACMEIVSGEGNSFDGIEASMSALATQAIIRNTGTTSVGYSLRNVFVAGNPAGLLMVDDAARGLALGAQAEFFGHLSYLDCPRTTTSDSTFIDHGSSSYYGYSGRYMKFGVASRRAPVLTLSPNSDQIVGSTVLANTLELKNTTGGIGMSVDPTGNITANGNVLATGNLRAGLRAFPVQAPTITIPGTGIIAPTTPVSFVSGGTAIKTITPPSVFTVTIGQGGGQVTLIPTNTWTTTTSGTGANIALASTAVINRPMIFTYDATTALWYPSY